MESDQKVVIIYDADKMTVQSANSLLKFIEEPEGGLLLLFLTTNPVNFANHSIKIATSHI